MKQLIFPLVLLRNNPQVYKNNFGHVFVLAGSSSMFGAAALTSLAAMRSGAGLVTLGIAKSLNLIAQKKVSNVVMTLPLKETKDGSISFAAYGQIKKFISKCNVVAIGPGLSTNLSTQKLVLKLISEINIPIVIDADGLNALVGHLDVLKKTKGVKILTPHPGELARLLKVKKEVIESNRKSIAISFSKKYQCIVLLKGNRTVVASAEGKVYINTSGNAGMATAGSGDVLTGMIAALFAQGLSGFEAAKLGAYLHGVVGDLAAKEKTKVSLIASDLIDFIPKALKRNGV